MLKSSNNWKQTHYNLISVGSNEFRMKNGMEITNAKLQRAVIAKNDVRNLIVERNNLWRLRNTSFKPYVNAKQKKILTAWRVHPQPETRTSHPPKPHFAHRTYSSPFIAALPKTREAEGMPVTPLRSSAVMHAILKRMAFILCDRRFLRRFLFEHQVQ